MESYFINFLKYSLIFCFFISQVTYSNEDLKKMGCKSVERAGATDELVASLRWMYDFMTFLEQECKKDTKNKKSDCIKPKEYISSGATRG